ncbi:Spo0B domain-containing protein [Halobacillus mangrovi]|uniref:Sporulation initiation phosphotransferase n=1 Tax=Halobacillus mangrovi TaxID=402384 RepID=A0A1W5ZUF7_9BACI|nr:Spo0B domain-containing protein [Halobacillus mangrovi]ARI76936.1 sporulation initiation phosphotransferase [Halobacillus mangrovi]
MVEKDMIMLLRHKRHDWMNQIQLIHGYASLGKHDRLMNQLEDLRTESEYERRILNSDAVKFPLWLLSFNWNHEQFRLKYIVKDELDLSRHDEELTALAKRMVEWIGEHKVEGELYEGTVHLYQGFDSNSIGLSWEWEGQLHNGESLKQRLNNEGFIATVFDDQELSIEMMIG